VSQTAKEALEYLLEREEFWKQKNFGYKRLKQKNLQSTHTD